MERNRLTVSQLNGYIKGVFDDELILKNIAVFGELFEASESGGTVFLTLRDEGSVLHCVMFGSQRELLPEVGSTVLATGSVEYYQKGSRVSFHVRTLEPFGEGNISRDLRLLREKLKAEGLFDNRPPLPAFIRSVGVITSETGAVIHDLLSVLGKRHGYIDVKLYPVKVQGEGADETIARAIAEADGRHDVIVVARGGGSGTDLEAFNSERTARAVAAAVTPVISAVGHEVDTTLCDLCASLRAGTPSIAGENICRINESYLGSVMTLLSRMSQVVMRRYSRELAASLKAAVALSDRAAKNGQLGETRMRSALMRLSVAAEKMYSSGVNRCLTRCDRLSGAATATLARRESALKELTGRLNGAGPLSILERGYARVQRGGETIRSAAQLSKGDELRLYMLGGRADVSVLNVETDDKEK